MNLSRSLLVAALLSGFAAVSFAQAPAAPAGPQHAAARHHHHHKHHGHHHHHHHHGAKAHAGR